MPSSDRLLLLERGGETVYFGDIGTDSSILREYLARYGGEFIEDESPISFTHLNWILKAHCPPGVNPAEYMLEAVSLLFSMLTILEL